MGERSDKNWPKDEFAQREVAQFWGWLIIPIVAVLAVMLFPALSWMKSKPIVILYCAQDQTYAEPLLAQFEQETGIKVKAVYDSEAVKTVGLANRLLAERSHPQCDVFWGNEELRTRQLAAQNVFRETNDWAAFGHRSRRIIINTNKLSLADAPGSLLDFTNQIWRGKVALAYPQFGTTAAHFHVLRQLWGEAQWLAWCRALVANQAKLVDGNSVVVKLVGRGEAAIGLTDADDILAGQREGLPVAMLPLGPESLLIPNTVAVIRNAPHPAAAQKLFEFLQRTDVGEQLVKAGALEGATLLPKVVLWEPNFDWHQDWEKILRDSESTTKQLNEVFLK
jgi:iron(III) transport system substrate-binding protein